MNLIVLLVFLFQTHFQTKPPLTVSSPLSNPSYMVCEVGDHCEFDQSTNHSKEIQSLRAVDVSPITEEYGNPGYEVCDYMGTMSCIWVDAQPGDPIPGFDHIDTSHALKRRTRLTCADKTRFLMTSEDGKKHCIKFSREEK